MNIRDEVMEFGVFCEDTFMGGSTLMRKCSSDKSLNEFDSLFSAFGLYRNDQLDSFECKLILDDEFRAKHSERVDISRQICGKLIDDDSTTIPGGFSGKSKNFVLKVATFCEREDIKLIPGRFFATHYATQHHDMKFRAAKTD